MINEYVKNICYYVILTTIIFNVFPDEKYVKYIKLFSGFILIIIIIFPITKVFHKDFSFNDVVNDFAVNAWDDELEKEINEYESVIEDRIHEKMTDIPE